MLDGLPRAPPKERRLRTGYTAKGVLGAKSEQVSHASLLTDCNRQAGTLKLQTPYVLYPTLPFPNTDEYDTVY